MLKKIKTEEDVPVKAKQPDLPEMKGPGIEKPSFPDIDAAAEDFADFHQRRKDLKAGEDEAVERLVAAMTDHELFVYEFEGRKHVSKIITMKKGKITVAVKEIGDREHE